MDSANEISKNSAVEESSELQLVDSVASEVAVQPEIKNSMDLAKYLSQGKTLDEAIPSAISSAQQDMKAYLSMYARSQLLRIEKLTNYLDQCEARLIDRMDDYDPYNFIQAMKTLQSSLSSAIELVKMVGMDDKYLSIIYNDNETYINNMQVNNKIDLGLTKESRDKLRSIIGKIKLMSPVSPNSAVVESSVVEIKDGKSE